MPRLRPWPAAAKNCSTGARSTTRPWCEEQDLVAQAPRLAEVVRGHHDLGAGARRIARIDRLDLARRAGIEARGRLVEEQHFRPQRPGARQREALLLAAGQHARRPVREVREPDLAPAPRARRARARAATPGDLQRVATLPSAERRSITGRWNTIACRRRALGAAPATPCRRVGASRPCSRRSSTLLPAPLAPRMTVRGPASTASETRLEDRAASRHETLLELRSGARRAHP